MKEFFLNMDTCHLFFWYIAIGASIVLIIQTLMTFIGTDAEEAAYEQEKGSNSFRLYSLRNFANFLLGFGWSGVVLFNVIQNNIVLGFITLIVGLLFIIGFYYLMKTIFKFTRRRYF